MARIVSGIGVPHTPMFPALADDDADGGAVRRAFAPLKAALDADRPDLLLVIDSDHFNTFFLDNYPTFAVGVDRSFTGPIDEVPAMPPRAFASHEPLGRHLLGALVRGGFDAALVSHFKVGHSLAVPLHFLDPGHRLPVVPVFVNGHLPPLPPAARCLALGEALGRAVRDWPEDIAVGVIGSGSFSLEVGGPRMAPGKTYGVPDPAWARRVTELMRQGAIDTLVAEASEAQMQGAGNVGGELLNWIAMIGAVGPQAASRVELDEARGHAFALWQGGDA